MAKKPTSKTEWTEAGGSAYRSEPTTAHKAIGYVYEEKPAFEEFNWLLWNLGKWVEWFEDIFTDYVEVGVGSDVDYNDINSAIADGKSKIVLVSDIEVSSVQNFSASDGILKTNGFKIKAVSDIPVDGVLNISGNNNEVDVNISLTDTSGNPTSNGILISGDSNNIKLKLSQDGIGGILTVAVQSTGTGNKINAYVGLSAAGTITTGLFLSAASEGNDCVITMNRKIGTFSNTYTDSGTANVFRIVDIT